MKTLKYPFTLFLAVCSIVAVSAKEITEKQAASIASSLRSTMVTRSNANAKATLTKIADSNATLVYVYNYSNNGGFVIVSGDDCAGKVLAYSPTGNFDPDNLSPAAKYWLDCQKYTVSAAINGNAKLTETIDGEADVYDTAVEPLCTSKWGQDAPYNNLCPFLTNSEGEKEQTVTGCAATALAQILYYWKQPATGKGTNTVTTLEGETLTVDFSQSTYDWANMTDTYDSSSSASACAAVAKLMYDCGIAMDMVYDLEDNGGSAAELPGLATALLYTFGFEAQSNLAENYRTMAALCEDVKEELDAKRPLFYTGQSSDGGHAFVCDGYAKNGLFHINWGWDGFADGYYNLRTLEPTAQGVGGGLGAFSQDQLFLTGMQPSTGTASYDHLYGLMVDNVTPSKSDKYTDKNRLIDINVNYIVNYGLEDFKGDIYLGITNSEGKSVEPDVLLEDAAYSIFQETSFSVEDLDFTELPKGTYTLHLYTKLSDGSFERIGESRSCFPYTIVVTDKGLEINDPVGADIDISSIKAYTDSDNLNTVEVSYTVTNQNTEYALYGNIGVAIVYDLENISDKITASSVTDVYLPVGEKSDVITGVATDTIPSGKSEGYLLFINTNSEDVIGYEEVKFSASGINSVVDDQKFSVTGRKGALDITGMKAGENITVSDISGRSLYNGKAKGSKLAVEVPANGVYVVKVGDKASMVLAK